VLSSANIRRWLHTSEGAQPDEFDVASELEAEDLWRAVKLCETGSCLESHFSGAVSQDKIPGLAFAICDLVNAKAHFTGQDLAAAHAVWRWLSRLSWPATEFDEQNRALASLALTLATAHRHVRDYPGMKAWEEQCLALISLLEPERSYLSAFATPGSANLDGRLLGDPLLLLAFCRQLEVLRNVEPGRALDRARRAFQPIRDQIEANGSTDLCYYAADVAMSAAMCAAHFRYREAFAWAQAAEHYLELDAKSRWLLPICDSMRIVILSTMNELDTLLAEAPAIVGRLGELGAERQIMSVRICEGQALKSLKRYRESANVLSEVIERFPRVDQLRLGVAYAQRADVKVETGDVSGAIADCQTAFQLLRETQSAMGIPYLQGVVGQLHRVMGQDRDAVAALREAADGYSEANLQSWAAYSRILAAETLLFSDRAPEALEELVTALGLLEGSEAEQELWAAVRLLRSALAATTSPSGTQLHRFRETLERIRKGHF
jgi:tetratricopeptide (TPR) repeat protein